MVKFPMSLLHSRVLLVVSSVVAFLLPVFTSAQTLAGTLVTISTFLNAIIGLFITLAIVVFFWGLIRYLWNTDQEHAHEGLKTMFWGLITIFVMVSIWGIIKLLQNTLRVSSTDPVIPKGIVVPANAVR